MTKMLPTCPDRSGRKTCRLLVGHDGFHLSNSGTCWASSHECVFTDCPWCGELVDESDQQLVHVTCHVAELAAYIAAIHDDIEARRALREARELLRQVVVDLSTCNDPEQCECSTARAHRYLQDPTHPTGEYKWD